MGDSMEIDSSAPRGMKRKAAESSAETPPKRIRALDTNVVNKIAAGEIIVAPMHALKELVENAVDAGSTSLEVLAKDGGLKLLQITDNGHGINRDDLPILCERFTTSKLQVFEDLTSIGTYGFRGEALASISHIAHLTVTTKTADSSCAWRAHYTDGKLCPSKPGQSADPKPIAGRLGTQITVEDLFYNALARQRAFRSKSDEYAKILDVVGRYAVHCTGVAFSCKKHGESAMSISVASNAKTVDRIRQIHGSSVANELVPFDVKDDKWGFKASGWTSNANYHLKKTTILLFINHRAVESQTIRKAVEHTYSAFLPKGGHPFIYLNLEIDPSRVDVNVHPTKREVNFLNEDEIIEHICDNLRFQLTSVDTSRTFTTQSLLPTAGLNTPTSTMSANQRRPHRETSLNEPGTQPSQRPTENNLVRTDAKARKITSMLPPTMQHSNLAAINTPPPIEDVRYDHSDHQLIQCRLTTVKDLRASVRSEIHSGLTETFASHIYVGLVDSRRRIAAIQGGVKLFLTDYGLVSSEFFYQVGLTDFGNFGSIKFDPSLSVRELVKAAVRIEKSGSQAKAATELSPETENSIDWNAIPEAVTAQLIGRREMLLEYFSMDISVDGMLHALPLLLRDYTPSLAKLPRFLMRLGPYVNWEDEQGCFDTFLRELASFYAPEQLPELDEVKAGEMEAVDPNELDRTKRRREALARSLEHVLFPAFKARLIATKGLLNGVVEVANLKGLYKVFERC